jgi:hypothetical protein
LSFEIERLKDSPCPMDIRPNDFENCLYVDEKNHRKLFAKMRVKRGDILIVNIGPGCRTPAIVDVDFEFSFKNVAIVNLPPFMDGKFTLLFLLHYRDFVFDELIKGGATLYSIGNVEGNVDPVEPKYDPGLRSVRSRNRTALTIVPALHRSTDRSRRRSSAIIRLCICPQS